MTEKIGSAELAGDLRKLAVRLSSGISLQEYFAVMAAADMIDPAEMHVRAGRWVILVASLLVFLAGVLVGSWI